MDHFRNICRKYSNKSPENHFFLQVNESNKEYVSLLSNLAYIYTATGINESKQQEWETRGERDVKQFSTSKSLVIGSYMKGQEVESSQGWLAALAQK